MKTSFLKSFLNSRKKKTGSRKTALPSKIFSKPWDTGALISCFSIFCAWLFILAYKYIHLAYFDWDFAIYAHAMRCLAHGQFFSSLFGTNFLTNHAEYITFLLIPIYRLFEHPFTLIVLKIMSLTGGAWVFYLISKRILGPGLALLLMLIYAFYPPNLYMLVYEFHFENLAVVFIFLLFYFLQENRLRGFLITSLLAALVKENIALVVAAFGIYAFFVKKDRRLLWSGGPILIGAGIFVLAMFFITPYLRHLENMSPNQYLGFYVPAAPAESTLREKMASTLAFLGQNIRDPLNLSYLKNLFLPLSGLPFLSPNILFLGAPIFLQHLLSSSFQMKVMYYHYAATAAIFVFLALAVSLARLKEWCRPRIFRLIVIFMTFSALINILSLRDQKRFVQMFANWKDPLDPARWAMLKKIPPQAPVIATFEFLPELINRKNLYTFYKIWRNSGFFSNQNFLLPDKVQYAVFDWNDPWLRSDILSADIQQARTISGRMRDIFLMQDWQVTLAADEVILFQKNSAKSVRAVEVSVKAFPGLAAKNISEVKNQITLREFRMDPTLPQFAGTIPITLTWQVLDNIDRIYLAQITVKSNGKLLRRHTRWIGYGIYPTYLWKKGEFIREHVWMFLPPNAPPGDYSMDINILDAGEPGEGR